MFGTNKLVVGLVGASSLGAIGVAGAYSAGLFSNDEKKETKTTVSGQLAKEGFTVLSISSTSDWGPVLEDYKKESTKTFLSAETDEAHKVKCQEVLRLENSDDYENAKRWCVKKEKMSEVLKKAGFKALDASSGTVANGETESWKEKVEKLITITKEPFDGIKSKIQGDSIQIDAKIGFLRAECKKIEIETLQTTNKDFEKKFELMKEWCSIKSNTQ